MRYNTINPDKKEAFVILTEEGELLEMPACVEKLCNESGVLVKAEYEAETDILRITPISDAERASRCFFTGSVNIAQFAKEANMVHTAAFDFQLDCAFDEQLSGNALMALSVALRSGQVVKVAYVWDEYGD